MIRESKECLLDVPVREQENGDRRIADVLSGGFPDREDAVLAG